MNAGLWCDALSTSFWCDEFVRGIGFIVLIFVIPTLLGWWAIKKQNEKFIQYEIEKADRWVRMYRATLSGGKNE